MKITELEVGKEYWVEGKIKPYVFWIDKNKKLLFKLGDTNGDSNISYNDVIKLNFIEIPQLPKLTDDEKAVLRMLDDEWKYIARCNNNILCVYEKMPTLILNDFISERKQRYLDVYSSCFISIKYRTCYKISDLLGV